MTSGSPPPRPTSSLARRGSPRKNARRAATCWRHRSCLRRTLNRMHAAKRRRGRWTTDMVRLVVGCGYLGSRVARRWYEAKDEVFVVTRAAERSAALAAEGYQPL